MTILIITSRRQPHSSITHTQSSTAFSSHQQVMHRASREKEEVKRRRRFDRGDHWRLLISKNIPHDSCKYLSNSMNFKLYVSVSVYCAVRWCYILAASHDAFCCIFSFLRCRCNWSDIPPRYDESKKRTFFSHVHERVIIIHTRAYTSAMLMFEHWEDSSMSIGSADRVLLLCKTTKILSLSKPSLGPLTMSCKKRRVNPPWKGLKLEDCMCKQLKGFPGFQYTIDRKTYLFYDYCFCFRMVVVLACPLLTIFRFFNNTQQTKVKKIYTNF